MVSNPGTIRHQPNFHPIDPSLSTNRESARITPSSPSPPTQRSVLPKATADPKSRSPMSSGALPGFDTGQFFASPRVSGEAVAAGAPLAAAVDEGGGVGLVPTGDGSAAALGLGGVAGEHAANVTVSSRMTAGALMIEPYRCRTLSSSQTIYTGSSRLVPATAMVRAEPTHRTPVARLGRAGRNGGSGLCGCGEDRVQWSPAPAR